MNIKNAKYQQIIQTVIELVGEYGINQVTISMIAKESEVSRGWIYKYIGKNLTEVISVAITYVANDFSRLSELTQHNDKEVMLESIFKYTQGMIEEIKKRPHILSIYFKHHGLDDLVGDKIRQVEGQYLEHLAENMVKCFNLKRERAKIRAEIIHFMRMGAIMLYFFKEKRRKSSDWQKLFWRDFHTHLKAIIFEGQLHPTVQL